MVAMFEIETCSGKNYRNIKNGCESMKLVLVLAFDGLEYNFVQQWSPKALKPAHQRKIDIPQEYYTKTVDPLGKRIYEPWSPFVWVAFLTEKLPRRIGLWKKTYYEYLRGPFPKIAEDLTNWIKQYQVTILKDDAKW